MILSVWRHGEAGHASSDQARCLTKTGETVLAGAGAGFAERVRESGWPPVSALKFSPWTRTEQTARILAQHVPHGLCASESLLAPGAAAEHFSGYHTPEGLHELWVSHQPFVSRAIATWCQEEALMPLAPGGYAVMRVTAFVPGGAELLWLEAQPSSVVIGP